jgi:hypothetical protein
MIDSEKIKYVDLIISMSVNYKMNGITWETYVSNLNLITKQLEESEKNEL